MWCVARTCIYTHMFARPSCKQLAYNRNLSAGVAAVQCRLGLTDQNQQVTKKLDHPTGGV